MTPVTERRFGFTPFAELVNLRLLAVGAVIGVATEVLTGVGIVGQVRLLLGL